VAPDGLLRTLYWRKKVNLRLLRLSNLGRLSTFVGKNPLFGTYGEGRYYYGFERTRESCLVFKGLVLEDYYGY
jgi:hypothetical protein